MEKTDKLSNMNKIIPNSLLLLFFAVFSFSCAATPAVTGNSSYDVTYDITLPPSDLCPQEPEPGKIAEYPEQKEAPTQIADAERPVRHPIPQYIMGQGLVPAQLLADFLLTLNPGADRDFVEELARIYVEEAAIEGVNHDVAFAQMGLETGFLRFGNLVTPDQNNFAGLGATGPGVPGERFPNPRIGVRAQIQHLKVYATDEPLNQVLVNPRFFFVRPGSSPTIAGLAGTWAADPDYAIKINNILERLYTFYYLYLLGNS